MTAAEATISEVISFRKQLEKALADDDQRMAERVIEGMQLRYIPIDILKATKMGIILAKLSKKTKEESLKKACLECIKVWQAEIRKRAGQAEKRPVPVAKLQAAKAPAASGAGSTAPSGPSSAASTSGSSAPKTSASAASVPAADLSSLPDKRRKLVELLGKSLAKAMKPVLKGTSDDQLQKVSISRAAELEQAMIKAFPPPSDEPNCSTPDYSASFRRIMFAVGNNVDLAQNVYSRSTDFSGLVRLPQEELASDDFKQRQEAERKAAAAEVNQTWERDNRKEILKAAGIKERESLFPCPQCKSKNTTNYLKQTRSADEPMTTFLTCHDCGYQWRFNA